MNLPDYNLDPPDDPVEDDDYEPDYADLVGNDFDDPGEADYAADRYERGFYAY